VQLSGKSSAYRLSEKNMPACQLVQYCELFRGHDARNNGRSRHENFKITGYPGRRLLLTISCAADSEKLKEESKKAYPNQEWKRPPKHWSPR
jgi:hypothetical protein